MEFVDEAWLAHSHDKAGFLVDLADQIIVQRGAAMHAAARRAPEIRQPVRPGIDQ